MSRVASDVVHVICPWFDRNSESMRDVSRVSNEDFDLVSFDHLSDIQDISM